MTTRADRRRIDDALCVQRMKPQNPIPTQATPIKVTTSASTAPGKGEGRSQKFFTPIPMSFTATAATAAAAAAAGASVRGARLKTTPRPLVRYVRPTPRERRERLYAYYAAREILSQDTAALQDTPSTPPTIATTTTTTCTDASTANASTVAAVAGGGANHATSMVERRASSITATGHGMIITGDLCGGAVGDDEGAAIPSRPHHSEADEKANLHKILHHLVNDYEDHYNRPRRSWAEASFDVPEMKSLTMVEGGREEQQQQQQQQQLPDTGYVSEGSCASPLKQDKSKRQALDFTLSLPWKQEESEGDDEDLHGDGVFLPHVFHSESAQQEEERGKCKKNDYGNNGAASADTVALATEQKCRTEAVRRHMMRALASIKRSSWKPKSFSHNTNNVDQQGGMGDVSGGVPRSPMVGFHNSNPLDELIGTSEALFDTQVSATPHSHVMQLLDCLATDTALQKCAEATARLVTYTLMCSLPVELYEGDPVDYRTLRQRVRCTAKMNGYSRTTVTTTATNSNDKDANMDESSTCRSGSEVRRRANRVSSSPIPLTSSQGKGSGTTTSNQRATRTTTPARLGVTGTSTREEDTHRKSTANMSHYVTSPSRLEGETDVEECYFLHQYSMSLTKALQSVALRKGIWLSSTVPMMQRPPLHACGLPLRNARDIAFWRHPSPHKKREASHVKDSPHHPISTLQRTGGNNTANNQEIAHRDDDHTDDNGCNDTSVLTTAPSLSSRPLPPPLTVASEDVGDPIITTRMTQLFETCSRRQTAPQEQDDWRPTTLAPILIIAYGGYGVAPFSVSEPKFGLRQEKRGGVTTHGEDGTTTRDAFLGEHNTVLSAMNNFMHPEPALLPLDSIMQVIYRSVRQNHVSSMDEVTMSISPVLMELLMDVVQTYEAFFQSILRMSFEPASARSFFVHTYRETLLSWAAIVICESAVGYATERAGRGPANVQWTGEIASETFTEEQLEEIALSGLVEKAFPSMTEWRYDEQLFHRTVDTLRAVIIETIGRVKGELYFLIAGIDNRGAVLEQYREYLHQRKAVQLAMQAHAEEQLQALLPGNSTVSFSNPISTHTQALQTSLISPLMNTVPAVTTSAADTSTSLSQTERKPLPLVEECPSSGARYSGTLGRTSSQRLRRHASFAAFSQTVDALASTVSEQGKITPALMSWQPGYDAATARRYMHQVRAISASLRPRERIGAAAAGEVAEGIAVEHPTRAVQTSSLLQLVHSEPALHISLPNAILSQSISTNPTDMKHLCERQEQEQLLLSCSQSQSQSRLQVKRHTGKGSAQRDSAWRSPTAELPENLTVRSVRRELVALKFWGSRSTDTPAPPKSDFSLTQVSSRALSPSRPITDFAETIRSCGGGGGVAPMSYAAAGVSAFPSPSTNTIATAASISNTIPPPIAMATPSFAQMVTSTPSPVDAGVQNTRGDTCSETLASVVGPRQATAVARLQRACENTAQFRLRYSELVEGDDSGSRGVAMETRWYATGSLGFVDRRTVACIKRSRQVAAFDPRYISPITALGMCVVRPSDECVPQPVNDEHKRRQKVPSQRCERLKPKQLLLGRTIIPWTL